MIVLTAQPTDKDFPKCLRTIPSPPKQLYYRGAALNDLLQRPTVAIVGSRNVSPYGKQVTQQLARSLAEQGITIISGLAFGVDSIAHQACLDANGLTVAVLPSPVEQVHPRSHGRLARRIIENGGTLVSEYHDDFPTYPQNFVARNRLVAGLADAVLITEATDKSGSLHTAKFAKEQRKLVLAVPGSIYSPNSAGTNELIRNGAVAITSVQDILSSLSLRNHKTPAYQVRGQNHEEQLILDLLLQGTNHSDELLERSQLDISQFSQVITMLEIDDKIRPLGGNQWGIV